MRLKSGKYNYPAISRRLYEALLAAMLFIAAGGLCCSCGEAGRVRGSDTLRILEAIDTLSLRSPDATDLTREAEAYADSVVAAMPLRSRVGMLFMPAIYARADAGNIRRVMEYSDSLHVGGLVLLKGDLRSVAIISDSLSRGSNAPDLFLAVDAENGLRMRFSDAPEFPWNRDLGRISDDQLLYEFGREIARECRAAGVNMVLGPVMDVVPGEGSHGLMRRRSLGSDPERVADLAIAYARGLEDGNVISVAKHFPGHGSSRADSHKALGEIRNSRSRMESVDLYPFRRYSEEGLSGVMVGHLSVAALDSLRRPAVVSPVVMQRLLRGELEFRGLVLTDALNMEGAMGVKGWEAIAAGADMVIAPLDTRGEIEAMLAAIADGRLDAEVVAERCRRILFYKYMLEVRAERRAGSEKVVEVVNREAPAVRDTLTSALRRSRNSSPQR